jgi:hypothetical protein
VSRPKNPTAQGRKSGSGSLPPPRDPELAVREEYELALAQGTLEALELFAVRHAGHELAAEALRKITRLRGNRQPSMKSQGSPLRVPGSPASDSRMKRGR